MCLRTFQQHSHVGSIAVCSRQQCRREKYRIYTNQCRSVAVIFQAYMHRTHAAGCCLMGAECTLCAEHVRAVMGQP